MNRTDFITMINDPGRIDSHAIGEIKELIDFFPYFQTAHLLLLKALYNSSDVKFSGHLASSSVHIADREVLYYLLNTISETDHGETVENLSEVITVADDTEGSVFELESEDFPVAEDHALTDNDSVAMSKGELLNFEYEPEIDNNVSEVNVSADNHEHKGFSEEEQKPEPESTSQKISQAELIDRFIQANPKIEPVRDKSDPLSFDVTKHQDDEKPGFITETLANIYINQEYYSRAIDIYEKLSLKFPEKSTYFAAQIEKVKELIKLK